MFSRLPLSVPISTCLFLLQGSDKAELMAMVSLACRDHCTVIIILWYLTQRHFACAAKWLWLGRPHAIQVACSTADLIRAIAVFSAAQRHRGLHLRFPA